jgi:hypothetical protein
VLRKLAVYALAVYAAVGLAGAGLSHLFGSSRYEQTLSSEALFDEADALEAKAKADYEVALAEVRQMRERARAAIIK